MARRDPTPHAARTTANAIMKLIAYSTIASTACAFVSTSPAAPAVSLRAVEARAVEAAPARDLTGRIPDCPATLWDDQNIDVAAARRGAAPLPECPTEHVARSSGARVNGCRCGWTTPRRWR